LSTQRYSDLSRPRDSSTRLETSPRDSRHLHETRDISTRLETSPRERDTLSRYSLGTATADTEQQTERFVIEKRPLRGPLLYAPKLPRNHGRRHSPPDGQHKGGDGHSETVTDRVGPSHS